MQEEIFVREMVKCLSGLNFQSIPKTEEALWNYLQKSTQDMFSIVFAKRPNLKRIHTLDSKCIYEFTVLKILRYLFFLDPANDRLFILGPALTQAVTEEEVLKQLWQYKVSSQMGRYLATFCKYLPVVPAHTLYKLGDLIIRRLTEVTENISIVRFDNENTLHKHLTITLADHHEEIMHMRQVEQRYEMSSVLTEAVKQGNLSMALSLLGDWNPGRDQPERNASPLRNNQNYCIVMNTQLRIALEGSGIHPYHLDYLSNEIGLKIEKATSSQDLAALATDILTRYCHLVQQHAYPNLKSLSRLAVTYMKDHLSDNLTVKGIAQILSVNADYLSNQFHKEMGETCMAFINRERVTQAAALLRNTDLQIQQIATMVGYNNTSYFAKQFKKIFHQSPQTYRLH